MSLKTTFIQLFLYPIHLGGKYTGPLPRCTWKVVEVPNTCGPFVRQITENSLQMFRVLIPDREIENHNITLTSNSTYRCFSVFPFSLFIA